MKRILLMLALVMARCGSGGGTLAFAQSCPAGHTPVQDTIYGPVAPSTGQPTLFFGTVTISANSAGHGAGGMAFGRIPMALTVTNGQSAACLIPNDTAIPVNTTYTAKYAYVGDQGAAAPWTETWSVPTSSNPVTLAAVRLLTAPPLLQGATGATGPSGTGNAPYSAMVMSQTGLTVTATTHGQGANPRAYCSDATSHAIDCDSSYDSSGNVTFAWPDGFTGSITILGGGTGPRGIQGIQGPQGLPGLPTPPQFGTYCVQVTNQTFYYLPGSCGVLTLLWTQLSDVQWAGLVDAQWLGLGNGPIMHLTWASLSNAQWTALTNTNWTANLI